MTIIWDWNGTLLDDVSMAVRVTNEVFSRYGYATMDEETYRVRFRFPVIEYYRDCGVKDGDFPEVANAWSDAYLDAFPGTPLQQDAAETVRRFHRAGLRQIVLSASKLENLRNQVGSYPALSGMFEELCGIGDIYAGGKTHLAHELIERTGLAPEELVFLGDSVHDAEVAAAVGARCILIARGHQTCEALEKAGVPVMASLREAADYLLNRRAFCLETRRLSIGMLAPEMAEAISHGSVDEENRRFVPDEVFETEEDARQAIDSLIASECRPDGPFVRPITLKASGEVIGYVQAVRVGGAWEIGYHIAGEHTGQGYATEAVRAYLPRMVETLGINAVEGNVHEANVASCRVLEKCGFRLVFEGEGSYQGQTLPIRRYLWTR